MYLLCYASLAEAVTILVWHDTWHWEETIIATYYEDTKTDWAFGHVRNNLSEGWVHLFHILTFFITSVYTWKLEVGIDTNQIYLQYNVKVDGTDRHIHKHIKTYDEQTQVTHMQFKVKQAG